MRNIVLIGDKSIFDQADVWNPGNEYNVVYLDNINHLPNFCTTLPLDLVILNTDSLDTYITDVISNIKTDPIFANIPIFAVIRDIINLASRELMTIIDDYIVAPFDARDLAFRISLCIARSQRVVEINPLTRLPGNIMIAREVQKRIDLHKVFALGYIDVDNFKPYNDRYGFSRGDEILRMTGRLISNIITIRHPAGGFVGHIGGDDFVFILPLDDGDESLVEVCKELIAKFDSIVPSFYDANERGQGFIESVDREGKKKTFPFTSISIGVVHNKFKSFSHYGEVSEIASDMKKAAKKHQGSCYSIDNRKA